MVTLSSRHVCPGFSVHIIIIIIINSSSSSSNSSNIIIDTIDYIVSRLLVRGFAVRFPTETRYVPRPHSPDQLWGSHRLSLNMYRVFFLQKVKR